MKINLKFLFYLCPLLLFLASCSDDIWDPNVIVKLNGEAIYKDELDRILELGFHPVVGSANDEKNKGTVHVRQIINKLIDEHLVLAEAEKAGFTVSEEELNKLLNHYSSAWFGANPPPGEMTELKETLRRQILLRKITEKIIEENTIYSAAEWSDFLTSWPMDKNNKYKVSVLLAPPDEKTHKELTQQKKCNINEISINLEKKGFPVIVSEQLWIKSDKIPTEVAEKLEQSWHAGKKIAGPVKLSNSWALYEILEVDQFNLTKEYAKANAAYENLAREKTFQTWVEGLRNKADIKINPAFSSEDNKH